MLKRLRWKIILINMTLVSIVLLLALVLVCYFSVKNAKESVFFGLERVARELQLPLDERPHSGDSDGVAVPIEPHVALKVNNDGTWKLLGRIGLSISDEILEQAISDALAAENQQDTLYAYRLVYHRQNMRIGTLLIFGSSSSIIYTYFSTFLICIAILFGGIAVFFFISLTLSSVAVKPIQQAWQQQKQFIADASHELKTPLTIILANANIMSSHKTETVAQQEQCLRSIQEETDQMRGLLDSMLALARTDDEQAVIELRPINISELIEEEILFLEPVAYEKQIPLETDLTKNLILNTDPGLLRRLLTLLVDNAIKYGTPGTPVTIRLSGNKLISLSVHNHGSIIPPEDLAHLFDRFYRSDKSRSTDGHGLGLAIARATAERLKGTLSVVSTEAEGTTFTAEFKA